MYTDTKCSTIGKLRGGGSKGRVQFAHTYNDIISVENLLAAWKEFLNGKRGKQDVQEFQLRLMDNILALHHDLKQKTYVHGSYYAFNISDPKPRNIHKATVRDRLVHHALYRKLYPFFDKTFIADSYSCRVGKGTHKAMDRFHTFARKASRNHTRTCFVLKCDIRKFFASIDHTVLKHMLKPRMVDKDIFWLLERVIDSFHIPIHRAALCSKGLPLGNLTSQLLVNIYMNEFDQFVKHQLKQKYYIRYADDFVFFSTDKRELEQTLRYIVVFLREELKLELHPNKVSIETISSGIDFLGWVHFPDHRVLRTSTKRRMLKRTKGLEEDSPTVQSYVGMLRWGNAYDLSERLCCRKSRAKRADAKSR